ncbi:MAG: ionic transporter y4hA [Roseomonas sp.]|nr:ionic transporter y4hA [Roseomonas sp.]
MAAQATDRIPLFFLLAPVAGIAAWLGLGKVGLELNALLILAVLLGSVIAAVHHAEIVALRVGEPFGGLILALSVTVIEAGLIISLMLSGDPKPALMRDTMVATIVLVLHGIAGLSILVGGALHRENRFRVLGANALLAVLMPMAVLVLIVPNHVVSVPGPYYSLAQLTFVSLVCLALYAAFLFVQTNRHRDYFLPEDGASSEAHARPSGRLTIMSFVLLCIALLAVVMLAKCLAPALEDGVLAIGAPGAIVGVIVAAIVLMPETGAALRAAAHNRMQSAINLALGSGVACIGLTLPAVAFVAWWYDMPLALGVSGGHSVLLALGFAVAMLTYGTGRTNILSGIVHLVLAATFVFTIFAP